MAHEYRGIACLKCPFDLAIYQRLLWEVMPRTIIEIGTAKGGSALWLADQLTTFGLQDFHVYSFDIAPPPAIADDRITFRQADATKLEEVASKAWLADLPRPMIVIEDSAHTCAVTRAVLEHFAPVMIPGEYLIVEDAISREFGLDDQYQGGPRQAIEDFLGERQEYVVDERWCNYYGRNVTWNVNGYLKRIEGHRPTYQWHEQMLVGMRPEMGNAWVCDLPDFSGVGDTETHPERSTLELLEDGRLLGPPHSSHNLIRNAGRGAYSHWGSGLWLSTSDGSDPRSNGRQYSVRVRNILGD